MQTSREIKKMIAINLAAIFFIGLDRLLKVFAFTNQTSEFNLFGEILKFNYKNNYYIAFSLPLGGWPIIILIVLIIMILISFGLFYFKKLQIGQAGALLFIIAGASSNLFDRIKYGFVIDYFDLKYFTVFNLADIMIVAGVAAFLIGINKKEVINSSF